MNIKEIKEIIKNTGFSFETYHDFTGIHDRYRDNHDVLINGTHRLVAVNKKRTLWKAFGRDSINPMPLPALLAVVSKGE